VSGAAERVRTLETGSTDRAANMQAFAIAALTLLDEALAAP
jgi:nicotinamide-nucleotide amidase